MQYNVDNLHHMITNEPRESWADIVKPLVIEEDAFGVTLNNNECFGFTLDSLRPDYRCKLNIDDIVYFEGHQWLVASLPLLDNRHSIEDIKTRCISVLECGSYLEILRPNSEGTDGSLYINDNLITYVSYNSSVSENELVLVPEDKVSEEMVLFKQYMLNPSHRVDLIW